MGGDGELGGGGDCKSLTPSPKVYQKITPPHKGECEWRLWCTGREEGVRVNREENGVGSEQRTGGG